MRTLYFLPVFLLNFAIYAQELSDSLLLYYKFDQDFLDSGANEFHGTNYGATFVTDRFGREDSAVYFNGIDNYIEFPNLEKLKPELPVSFSFWVKFEEVDYLYTSIFRTSYEEDVSSGVHFNTDIELHRYTISYGDGTPQYSPQTRRTYLSTKSIDNKNWHNVIAVVNGPTDMKLIIDCVDFGGIYVGSGGDLQYSASPGVIGRGDRNNNPGDFFKGVLDDFMYWNRALTDEEIIQLCEKNTMNTHENLFNNDLRVYPNPAQDFVLIQSNFEIKSYSIYDLSGAKIKAKNSVSNKIDLRDVPSGVYILKLFGESTSLTKRLIIK